MNSRLRPISSRSSAAYRGGDGARKNSGRRSVSSQTIAIVIVWRLRLRSSSFHSDQAESRVGNGRWDERNGRRDNEGSYGSPPLLPLACRFSTRGKINRSRWRPVLAFRTSHRSEPCWSSLTRRRPVQRQSLPLILAFPGFEFSLAKSVTFIGATPVTNSSRAALGSTIRNRAFKLPTTIQIRKSQAWRRCCGAVAKIRARHSRGGTRVGHADGLPEAKWLESLVNNWHRGPTGLDKPRDILSTC